MAYVIGADCIDNMDRACVDECPVDCIYEGARKLYINPTECIDCGACEPACPVDAITADRSAETEYKKDNRVFFEAVLPGLTEPVGNPGGAADHGPVGVDTELVAGV